jgi:hypothetical protein
MFRHCLVFLIGMWAAGPALAATWADALFDRPFRDFGSVPRGPTLTNLFHLTNHTAVTVHIASVRVSCGCVTATALKTDLEPGEETAILAEMDSRRFYGSKTVTIYVQFDRPRWEEVRLSVQANSRDDVTLTPEALAFGPVRYGSTPAASVSVAFLGNGDWRIDDARCDSNYVITTVQERRRDYSEVAYQVTARLRVDTPIGNWYTDVWLTTNNPMTPRVRVPLTVEIQSALSVSPPVALLGQVKAGTEAERKIIVRGAVPFRITAVRGSDGQVTVQDTTKASKPVHVLTVRVKSDKPGDLERTIRVQTDLKDNNAIEFRATGQIVP